MQRIRNLIPNLLTLGNLACGLVGIVWLLQVGDDLPPSFAPVGWLMLAAMAFDFLDGFVARALKATSPIGKELDSLSDLVSFGVLPGLMVYSMLRWQLYPPGILREAHAAPWFMTLGGFWVEWLPYLGLVIPLFSAYRLAKFNVDTRQSYGFLGLATPANALFFLSIFLIFGEGREVYVAFLSLDQPSPNFGSPVQSVFSADLLNWLHHPFVLIGLTLLFSVLLVTEIPLLAMKFKDYSFRNNWPRYVLILVSITLLAIFWIKAIPLVIVCYFIFSFIDTRLQKHL